MSAKVTYTIEINNQAFCCHFLLQIILKQEYSLSNCDRCSGTRNAQFLSQGLTA